ncbi:MAG: M24 family metallopeptidase [Candidatus Helarchaeota archaeon]
MDYYINRIKQIQEIMRDNDIDYSIIFNSRHIFYFSGTAQHSILLIPNESDPILYVRRDFERAKKESHIKDVVQIKSTYNILNGIDEFETKKYNIGIEKNFMRVSQYEGLKKYLKKSVFKDIATSIQNLRMIKDELELNLVRKSAKICEKVQDVAREYIRPGISELELGAEIQHLLTKSGSTFSYFDGYWGRTPFIIASGENLWARSDFPPVLSGIGPCNAEPHGPSNRIIQEGDIVVVDIASVIEGYNADHSRTYFVGKPSEKFKKIYNILLKVRKKILPYMKNGIKISEFCKNIIKLIPKEYHSYIQGYHQYREGFGHGIGLCLDELPFLLENNEITFQPNMVIAFEPKIIIPDWGAVNFEDDFIIKKEGLPEQITNSPTFNFS